MDSLDLVRVARSLIDIDSTTGREAAAGRHLSALLRARGYHVTEQGVDNERVNLFATCGAVPHVVLSTHYDCVPPFFPSGERDGMLLGRGSCDAKGILAAQLAAVDRLRAAGEHRVALLFVVGEERGSDGAQTANALPGRGRFLINGEPTDNRLAAATRGVLRVRLVARGRAAHSAYPHLGESAIEKLVDALMALRGLALPEDASLGTTHYSIGGIQGGVAPNVIPASAEAELLFRTVGPAAALRDQLRTGLGRWVDVQDVLEVPPVTLHTEPGFETAVFPFTTDVACLSAWGTPLLLGPGSVLVAHTDHEHVSIAELHRAVDVYCDLATRLLVRG